MAKRLCSFHFSSSRWVTDVNDLEEEQFERFMRLSGTNQMVAVGMNRFGREQDQGQYLVSRCTSILVASNEGLISKVNSIIT